MILYELVCSAEHRFEAWFRDSAAFDKQRKARIVSCPLCGDAKVRKAIMAPALTRSKQRGEGVTPASPQPTEDSGADRQHLLAEVVAQLREHVEKNCDYVGDSFPEEARRIHYGEVEARGIYGEASEAEAQDLKEEGVAVGRLPFMPKRNS